MDSVFYRGVLLSNDDMFKRGILALIEIWQMTDGNPELKENNPLTIFN